MSSRAARRYVEAHAVEMYGEQINKAIEQGHRVINVPRGAARVLADALTKGTAEEPGWNVRIDPCATDPNMLSLMLIDSDELTLSTPVEAGEAGEVETTAGLNGTSASAS